MIGSWIKLIRMDLDRQLKGDLCSPTMLDLKLKLNVNSQETKHKLGRISTRHRLWGRTYPARGREWSLCSYSTCWAKVGLQHITNSSSCLASFPKVPHTLGRIGGHHGHVKIPTWCQRKMSHIQHATANILPGQFLRPISAFHFDPHQTPQPIILKYYLF